MIQERSAVASRVMFAALMFCLGARGVTGDAPAGVPADQAPKQLPVVVDGKASNPVVIRIRGVITFATQSFVDRQLEAVRATGVDLLIFDIDSPGGEAQASMDIAETIARIEWAKTVAFIENEALSGAAFIALGCERIFMRPDAKIGDAGPIVLGEDSMFRHAPQKIVSILAAQIRDVAESRGHPPALAEAMVDRNLEVFFYRNTKTGQTLCMTADQAKVLDDADDWKQEKPVPGSRKDRFLTLNGTEAVETGLATATIKTFQDVKDRFGMTSDPKILEYTWVDTLVTVLNAPFVTGLLLVVALVCLYLEFYTAGLGLFGIISALCFALFFWSRFLGGTADWLELLLFLGGLACIAIEIFVFPGVTVFGVTGILLVLAGLTLASAPMSGRLVDRFDSIASSAATVGASLAAFIIVGAVLAQFLGAMPIFRRMALAPPAPSLDESDMDQEVQPLGGEVGREGRTRTPLRPAGKARVGEQDLDVVAESTFIDAGKPVRIVLVQGNRVVVREIDEPG